MTNASLLVLVALLGVPILGLVAYLVYRGLSRPMRQQEKAQCFLDLLQDGLGSGRTEEQLVSSLVATDDACLGGGLRQIEDRLHRGEPFYQALASVPQLVPAPVAAMLRAGREMGRLDQVIPACRRHLRDAIPKLWTAHHYLVLLLFVVTPAWLLVLGVLFRVVLPKFQQIGQDMEVMPPAMFRFVVGHSSELIWFEVAGLLVFYGAVGLYLGWRQPLRLVERTWPGLADSLAFRVPWRRARMQRDFSSILATLLDCGIPEPRAVTLAAATTANQICSDRAKLTVEDLARGIPLNEALKHLDQSGEFQWRLANAMHNRAGFRATLAGWHEALDARAFNSEQVFAQVLTTGVVLLNGVIVGSLAVGLFGMLVKFIDAGSLW